MEKSLNINELLTNLQQEVWKRDGFAGYHLKFTFNQTDRKMLVHVTGNNINIMEVCISNIDEIYNNGKTVKEISDMILNDILEKIDKITSTGIVMHKKTNIGNIIERFLLVNLKFMIICFIWNLLEVKMYGIVQEGAVDNLVAFILYYFILKSEFH